MFLAAGSWAVLALALWIPMFLGYMQLPTRFSPLVWHIHEMLFGFVMAAIGGFLLTAIPNWTGRPPVAGYLLAVLAGLWLLGRIACSVSADLPAWLAILMDLSFPGALLVVAAREIIAGRSWRNLPITALLAAFVLADLLMHLESIGVSVPGGLGWRLALVVPILLISVIGGRIIPNFTRNWLLKRDGRRLPAPSDSADTAALDVLHAGLILWAVFPESRLIGLILITSAGLNGWRLLRWVGLATIAEPLLFILHLAYGWLVLGVALLGLSLFGIGVPLASAIHALTAGAIGTMIIAVMPRVTLGHTGRELTADRPTVAIFVLITAAAIMRVAASWNTSAMILLVALSGACWIGAFGLFEFIYGPMLLARRPGDA